MWFNEEDDFDDTTAAPASVESAAAVHASPAAAPATELLHTTKKLPTHTDAELEALGAQVGKYSLHFPPLGKAHAIFFNYCKYLSCFFHFSSITTT